MMKTVEDTKLMVIIYYLADINESAKILFEQIVKSLAKQEQVTEELKVENIMLWVRKINNIRNRATEQRCFGWRRKIRKNSEHWQISQCIVFPIRK